MFEMGFVKPLTFKETSNVSISPSPNYSFEMIIELLIELFRSALRQYDTDGH